MTANVKKNYIKPALTFMKSFNDRNVKYGNKTKFACGHEGN